MTNAARKLAAATLPLAALAACAQGPLIDRPEAAHAQRLAPSSSMIGEACDGHHPAHGLRLRLRGHSLLLVSARVNEVVGGREVPFAQGAAPADWATSALPRPVFMARPDGRAACAGVALKTVVRQDRDGPMVLAWDLEVAMPEGERLPADAWRVQGETPVQGGSGARRLGFSAAGRDFVAYVAATPGPAWVAAERASAARAASAANPAPAVGRALPDEQPGRTLDDVTRAGPATIAR